MTERDHLREWFGWAYEGVDHTLAGNGGEECINFIPRNQKIIETIILSTISLLEIIFTYSRITLPEKIGPPERAGDRTGKKILLFMHALTFGIELGFKLSTKQLIWILNPCHLVTMMQLYLLAAPPNKLTMAVFRIHMHCLSGATIAVVFPVVNTRLLPMETEIYYIQHVLMLVIPFYLMRIGGVYRTEALSDFNWALMAKGLLYLYHWLPLQWLAINSLVNLNNMVCPAISDPFYGKYYRMCAAVHQTATVLLHGKLYTWVARKFLPKRRDLMVEESNGHAKLH